MPHWSKINPPLNGSVGIKIYLTFLNWQPKCSGLESRQYHEKYISLRLKSRKLCQRLLLPECRNNFDNFFYFIFFEGGFCLSEVGTGLLASLMNNHNHLAEWLILGDKLSLPYLQNIPWIMGSCVLLELVNPQKLSRHGTSSFSRLYKLAALSLLPSPVFYYQDAGELWEAGKLHQSLIN